MIQYINKDADNFYSLNMSIMENIGELNDNIIEDIKYVFIKNNIIFGNYRNRY